MKAWQGSCGVSLYEGIVSPAYYVFDLKIDNPRFFNYAIRSRMFIDEFNRISNGIRVDQWDLSLLKLKYVLFQLPPRDEQDQIVRFLDWKVSQINRLINAKRRQIELLREQKLATIDHAITQEKCKKTRIGHFYTSILGKMLAPQAKSSSDTYEKYLCAKDVHFDGIDITSAKEMWFSREEKRQYQVQHGDLLVVEGGAGAGGSYIFDFDTDEKFYVQNSIQIIRTKGQSTNKYLYYYLFSLVKQGFIDCVCEKATIPHFTKERLLNTSIPVVDGSEQSSIVRYLDEQCERIDKIIGKLNDEIALFTEYRTRLISDVVTGKFDVRGVFVPEYESVAEDLAREEVEDVDSEMVDDNGEEIQ